MTTFYPVSNGRATSQLGITRLLFQINHDELAIQDLQTQLSTGRRINLPSQDPAAAIRGLAAQRQLEFKAQVDDNLSSADTILGASESTLAQAQSILNEMRGVAVESVGTTFSPEEVDAYVSQVQAAIDKLLELGNSKFRDQYIFSGSDVLAPPLVASGDTIQFKANAEDLNTISDFSTNIAANVTANDAFGVKSSRVVSSVDLNPSLAASTQLSRLNRGDGIRGGAISFSDGVEKLEIDLANAFTISDVIESINGKKLSGRNLEASLSSSGLVIRYEDGLPGILRIDEVGSGFTAADLGINNSESTGISPVLGTDLNPVVTLSTKLSQLFNGVGLPGGELFQIKQGDKTFAIPTANLVTVEDLINRIHSSGAQVNATIDPSGRFLAIQSTESGSALSIGENGGTLATRLGIRTMSVNTQLSDLNFGQGIFIKEQSDDLILTRTNGSKLAINLDGAQTVGDVLNRINNNVDNFNPSTRIVASLSTQGNGIVLTAANGSQPITVQNAGGSGAAWGLGLVPRGQDTGTAQFSSGSFTIRGSDVSGVEVEGVFSTLIRLRQAVAGGNTEDMERITSALDDDIQRMSLARGLVGTRQQSIQRSLDLSAEQQVQLKQLESNELDADLAQVISDLTAREAALQASLKLMGQSSRLSLFDYI
jgi:flagellar hook-associated protein 3 FlgL